MERIRRAVFFTNITFARHAQSRMDNNIKLSCFMLVKSTAMGINEFQMDFKSAQSSTRLGRVADGKDPPSNLFTDTPFATHTQSWMGRRQEISFSSIAWFAVASASPTFLSPCPTSSTRTAPALLVASKSDHCHSSVSRQWTLHRRLGCADDRAPLLIVSADKIAGASKPVQRKRTGEQALRTAIGACNRIRGSNLLQGSDDCLK